MHARIKITQPLTGQSYEIKATVSNWAGNAISLTRTVTKSALAFSAAHIKVFLVGTNQIDVSHDAALTVATDAYTAQCRSVATLSYAWSKVSGPAYYIPAETSVQSALTIPPNSLNPGQTYVFQVVVSADTYGTVTSSAPLNVTVRVDSIPAPVLTAAKISLTEKGFAQVGSRSTKAEEEDFAVVCKK